MAAPIGLTVFFIKTVNINTQKHLFGKEDLKIYVMFINVSISAILQNCLI